MDTTTVNGVRHETSKGGITLDKIYKGDFQKTGTLTAQIRQLVTTKSFYPAKKTTSDLQESIFDNQEFGFTEQEFEATETRVAWIFVPEGIAQEEVMKRLAVAQANGATIYRVLANEPILDENQKYAIKAGLKTLDEFADSQVVRYPETDETKAKGIANKLTLDKANNVQYRRTFFWKTAMKDVDARDANKVYHSAAIKAELAGTANVLEGQTI